MPLIPTAKPSSGALDTAANLLPRSEINSAPANAMAQGAAQLAQNTKEVGAAVTQLGGVINERVEQVEDQNTAIGLEKLKQAQQADDLKAADEIPADGTGYAESRTEAFGKRFDTFVDGLPDRLKEKYRPVVENLRTAHMGSYAQAQQTQAHSYAGTAAQENLGSAIAAAQANPDSTQQAIDQHAQFVETLALPRADKDKLIKANRDAIRGAAWAKTLDSNDPTDGPQSNKIRSFGASNSKLGDAVFNSLIKQESGGRVDAYSSAGAMGVTQVMPQTARGIARERGDAEVAKMSDGQLRAYFTKNPDVNVAYGRHYFDQQLRNFNGDYEAALVAYNGGPLRAQKWLAAGRNDAVLPAETRQYYKKILGRVNAMGAVATAGKKFAPPPEAEDDGPDDGQAITATSGTKTIASNDSASQARFDVSKRENLSSTSGTDGTVTGTTDSPDGSQETTDLNDTTRTRTIRGEGKYTAKELADAEVGPASNRQASLAAGFMPSQLSIDGKPNPGEKPRMAMDAPDGGRGSDASDLPATVTVKGKDGYYNIETVHEGRSMSLKETIKGFNAGEIKGTRYKSVSEAQAAGGTVVDPRSAVQGDATGSTGAAPGGVDADGDGVPDGETHVASRVGKAAQEHYQRRWSSYTDPDALGMPDRPETFDPTQEGYKTFKARQDAWDSEFKRRGAAMRKEDTDKIGEEREASQDERAARADARAARVDAAQAHSDTIGKLERLAFQNQPGAADTIAKALADGTIHDRQELNRILGQSDSIMGEFISRGLLVDKKTAVNKEVARREAASVKGLLADDIASVRETGKGVENLSEDRIRKSLGDDAYEVHARERLNAQRYNTAVSGMDVLPKADIESRLSALAPRPGAGFVDAQQTYDDARKYADDLYKRRNSDPALAVDRDQGVRAAYDAVAKAPDSQKAAALNALGEARMNAQAAAGIPEAARSPITRKEADDIVASFDQAQTMGRQTEALKGLVKGMYAAYGKHADRAIGVVMDQENADDAMRKQAGKIFRTLANGGSITREQGRVIDDGVAANSEARAIDTLNRPAPASILPNDVHRDRPIPPAAIQHLRANPGTAADFDRKFGAGLSKNLLTLAPR